RTSEHSRAAPAATEVAFTSTPAGSASAIPDRPRRNWSRIAIVALSGALILALSWGTLVTVRLWQDRQQAAVFLGTWTPELDQLWKPFFNSNRPLIVSIADPPFVQFKGHGAYRDLTLNRWEDIVKSPDVLGIRKAL